MAHLGDMRFVFRLALVALFCAVISNAAPIGSNIGVWTSSSRSWLDPSDSNLQGWLSAYGHTLTLTANAPDSTMQAFVITETLEVPTFVPALINWIQLGGRLFLMTDFGLNIKAVNQTLCQVTSGAMYFTTCSVPFTVTPPPTLNATSAGVDKSFVTTRPKFDVATADNGKNVATSLGYQITGGNPLVGGYGRWLPLGAGFIYVFGDRLDNNALLGAAPFFSASVTGVTPSTDPNAGLILALLATDVPEPSALTLLPLALAGFSLLRGRRS